MAKLILDFDKMRDPVYTEKKCSCGQIHSLYRLPQLKGSALGLTYFNCSCGSTCVVYTEKLKALALGNLPPTDEQILKNMQDEIRNSLK